MRMTDTKFQQFADFQTCKYFVLRKIISIIIDDKREKREREIRKIFQSNVSFFSLEHL